MATVVLVHGAWGGSWVWERVMPLLEERDVPTVVVDLPSVGAEPDAECSLAADAAAVTRVLGESAGPFVVCGHSYGGMVITHACAGRSDVSRLVYLCAFMPDAGDSLYAITGGPSPWIKVLDDGRTLPDLERAARVGYLDCDDETRTRALARLRPQVPAPFHDAVPVAAWREIPATYVSAPRTSRSQSSCSARCSLRAPAMSWRSQRATRCASRSRSGSPSCSLSAPTVRPRAESMGVR